jgi:hypothetical protein
LARADIRFSLSSLFFTPSLFIGTKAARTRHPAPLAAASPEVFPPVAPPPPQPAHARPNKGTDSEREPALACSLVRHVFLSGARLSSAYFVQHLSIQRTENVAKVARFASLAVVLKIVNGRAVLFWIVTLLEVAERLSRPADTSLINFPVLKIM